ncbi:protein ORF70 [Cyprinid herpesvirus 3]|uniref:Protein ORF70 n=1 Tax=Cyprinid herpesvirus 3 TaxID=180230 RepID=A3QMN8_CYHV3|nr:unnamed protein product [Cyprinid herpesvirus 3]ABC55174.1 hypothetical protein [Cyprinid herpesvirus 3]ABG42897.1 protein ORF70 [Cyprinid herpesvirus 3]AJP55558.1 protein ORF70 [Cyprinid herpesvirus 3]AJP55713.1 protein ORF70 [Cyprinid herpesvirus 3]AOO32475.1 protein ORF70 [Cyprinid herpesvirus 3]
MEELLEKVAPMVAREHLDEFKELKRTYRGKTKDKKVKTAMLFAAGRTAEILLELETARERIKALQDDKAKVEDDLKDSLKKCDDLGDETKALQTALDAARKENADNEPRRVHLAAAPPNQAQLLALQVKDLTRRHKDVVEREAQRRAEAESLARRVRDLEDELRKRSSEHQLAEEASKEKIRDTLRLLNTAGSMRHMDFLPVVRGRSYKEVTLNAYLQYVRTNEQLYREKCGTFLTQGTANQMYDNACMGAVSQLSTEWVSKYFVEPLAPYSMVHHYEEFLHFRIVLCNCTNLFAQLLTVVQLNAVATENRRKVSLTEFKSLANICDEPKRQFRAGIEIHRTAFQPYLEIFVEYVRAERAATEPLPCRSAQYGPLENRFKVMVKGALIEDDRNATAVKRKRMRVDDLLNFYGATPPYSSTAASTAAPAAGSASQQAPASSGPAAPSLP